MAALFLLALVAIGSKRTVGAPGGRDSAIVLGLLVFGVAAASLSGYQRQAVVSFGAIDSTGRGPTQSACRRP